MYAYIHTQDLVVPSLFILRLKFFMIFFASHQQHVDSASVTDPTKDVSDYLDFSLLVFPKGQERFNGTGILAIALGFSNQSSCQRHLLLDPTTTLVTFQVNG